MATTSFLRSNTLAGILFRTVFVVIGWHLSLMALDWGIYLFTPAFGKIYFRSEAIRALIGTVLWLLVLWAVVLLPERRSWAEVGWTREQVSSSLLLGGLIGSGVWLLYVGIIAACGVYRIVGHYACSHILVAAFVSLLTAAGWETLYRGYVQKSLEQKQGSGIALILAAVMYGSESLIAKLVEAALDKHHTLTLGPVAFQNMISYSAIDLFCGAAYLWSRRLWTAVGVQWGCSLVGFLLADNTSDRANIAVFRVSIVRHSLDPNGIGYITKVAVFIIAAVVMMLLAKRRGHWQERVSSRPQS